MRAMPGAPGFRIAVQFPLNDFGGVTMSQGQETGIALPDEVRNLLAQCLGQLMDHETEADLSNGQLTEAAMLLESLPLSTSEFGLATNRLNNARRYMESNERGAARYELLLLIGGLTPKPEAQPSRRRTRQKVA